MNSYLTASTVRREPSRVGHRHSFLRSGVRVASARVAGPDSPSQVAVIRAPIFSYKNMLNLSYSGTLDLTLPGTYAESIADQSVIHGRSVISATTASTAVINYDPSSINYDLISSYLSFTASDVLSTWSSTSEDSLYGAPVIDMKQYRRKRASALLRSWLSETNEDEIEEQKKDFEMMRTELEEHRQSSRKLYP